MKKKEVKHPRDMTTDEAILKKHVEKIDRKKSKKCEIKESE
jgi:hypothetical protein